MCLHEWDVADEPKSHKPSAFTLRRFGNSVPLQTHHNAKRCQVCLSSVAGSEFAGVPSRMQAASPPSANLTCPRCGFQTGVPMSRSNFLIAYSCTACKQRWLVDTELLSSMSFDTAYG